MASDAWASRAQALTRESYASGRVVARTGGARSAVKSDRAEIRSRPAVVSLRLQSSIRTGVPPMSIRKVVPIASVVAVAAMAFMLRAAAASPAPATTRASALDDPTIVAIFDAANTSDIETGELGAKKGSTKAVRHFGAILAHDRRTGGQHALHL